MKYSVPKFATSGEGVESLLYQKVPFIHLSSIIPVKHLPQLNGDNLGLMFYISA